MPIAVLERESQPKKIEVSPGFDVLKAAEKCRTLSRESALETLVGDYKFQAWEITGIPLSDMFKYKIVKDPNNPRRPKKLIFECDTEMQSDIRDVTSKEWRNGWEYNAVNAWTETLIAEDAEIAKLPKDQQQVRTLIQINPMQDKDDPRDSSTYQMSQVNVAKINGSGEVEVNQIQFPGTTEQCARFFKLVTQSEKFDPAQTTKVDQMMMSFGIVDRDIPLDELLNTAGFVTGKRLPSLRTIERQKSEILSNAYFAALRFYNDVPQKGELDEFTKKRLEKVYGNYLAQTLPLEFIADLRQKVESTGEAQIMIETSCGAVNLGGPGNEGSILSLMGMKGEKWTYQKGNCVKCPQQNVDVGPCFICKDCEKSLPAA